MLYHNRYFSKRTKRPEPSTTNINKPNDSHFVDLLKVNGAPGKRPHIKFVQTA